MLMTLKTRPDFDAIIENVPTGAKVLDVGCGDGELLELLQTHKNADVRGLEISDEGVASAVARGLSVIQGDADKDLGIFPANTFDMVILSNTIQATKKPKEILEQIKRIGNRAIISVPNFAYWKVRSYLFLKGEMPVTKELPDTWYDSKNIHFCTARDFEKLALECGFKIISVTPTTNDRKGHKKPHVDFFVNLFAQKVVFALEKL